MWTYLLTSFLAIMGLWLQAASITGLVKDERTNLARTNHHNTLVNCIKCDRLRCCGE